MVMLSMWQRSAATNRNRIMNRRSKLQSDNVESDQSQTEPGQAFVHTVDAEVKEMNGVFMKRYHGGRRSSYCSSLSSVEVEELQSTSHARKLLLDELPINGSFDETQSGTKSKSLSTDQGRDDDRHNDEVAKTMKKMITRRGSLNITNLLAERASVIESIAWLGRHVPRCVLRDLSREVMGLHKKEESLLSMPHPQIYRAALLFIDMSGFTKLSLLLDLESLSKVCRECLHLF